jgi:hypothetical protein
MVPGILELDMTGKPPVLPHYSANPHSPLPRAA